MVILLLTFRGIRSSFFPLLVLKNNGRDLSMLRGWGWGALKGRAHKGELSMGQDLSKLEQVPWLGRSS